MKVRIVSMVVLAPLTMALTLSLTLVSGCAPPEQIVLATPPGVDPPRPELSDADKAEAIGETVPQGEATPKRSRGESTVIKADNPPTAPGEKKTTGSGLTYETIKPGTGSTVKPGQKIQVLYTGRLAETGEIFDSTSKQNNTPLSITLGAGQVIPGWDEGIASMKIGEIRRLTIPPRLGYGTAGKGPIPPNATLIFEIEMLDAQ